METDIGDMLLTYIHEYPRSIKGHLRHWVQIGLACHFAPQLDGYEDFHKCSFPYVPHTGPSLFTQRYGRAERG